MPRALAQIAEEFGGALIFSSAQDTILDFLSGGDIANYEGVCLALVSMWLGGDSAKKSPLKGTVNKVRALQLQSTLEDATLDDGEKIETIGAVVGKNFWWRAESKIALGDRTAPATYLVNDPSHGRDGLHILVIYFPEGGGHALGVWRFPSGVLAFYDPNCGACAIPGDRFRGFLAAFLADRYSDADKFSVISYWDART